MESKLDMGSSKTTIGLLEFFAFKNSNVNDRKFYSPVLNGKESRSIPKKSFSFNTILIFFFASLII